MSDYGIFVLLIAIAETDMYSQFPLPKNQIVMSSTGVLGSLQWLLAETVRDYIRYVGMVPYTRIQPHILFSGMLLNSL